MLNVQIDEEEARNLFLQKVEERLREYEAELTFWDTKELKRQTGMSWNTIQDQFFFDSRFPKYKVGGRWMFPAAEAREFLLKWIKEQGR